MLTLNTSAYLNNFSREMTFDEVKSVFGQIPVAEYCLMLGMEQCRSELKYSKEDMLLILFQKDSAITGKNVYQTPVAANTEVQPSCCGGGQVR